MPKGDNMPGEGGGRLIFAGYVQLASQSPYPIIVYSVANYRPHLSHFLILRTYPFFRLNKEHFTFHPQYKRSGMFANHKYENVRPHSSNCIKNATPL